MGEYFIGQWSNGTLKPFVDKKGKSGNADRFVGAQPLIIKEDGNNTLYNMRKMNELPNHLALAAQVDLLKQQTLLNFQFIYHKLKATSLDRFVSDNIFKIIGKKF